MHSEGREGGAGVRGYDFSNMFKHFRIFFKEEKSVAIVVYNVFHAVDLFLYLKCITSYFLT